MAEPASPSQLVVVGASAGGIEALSALVATLPADFPAPLVIAQHLDPGHASRLGEILARRSTLPVRTVTNHEPMAPGVVFVVPANRHVTITDHEVELQGDGGAPSPSVDLLLTSAARVFGERLIAVVLTGMGHDGAAGARAVHEAGGTVIIQDPTTARFPAMPLSLAPTTVDIVATVEQIGPILHSLLTNDQRPLPSDESRTLRTLLEQLRAQSGMDFSGYKASTIRRRLHRRMAAVRANDLEAYLRYVQEHPDEYQRLASTFLIKVTEFFRDPELFDYLRSHTLPELIREARTRGNELRLWSAGCATGEEAYSLAILVAELLGDELARFNVRVFATDLDPEAIAFARRGVYPAAAFTGVPPELVDRYFTAMDGAYEVKKGLRALLVFGHHDLGQRSPFPRIDLVLCRNVLIYFTAEVQRRALHLFAFALRDGGWLVLGKAETVSPLADYFVPAQQRLKVWRRQGDHVLLPPAPLLPAPSRPAPAPTPSPRERPAAREQALERIQQEALRLRGAGERAAEARLLNLPVGIVVVNRRYDIQSINAAARRLLGIHGMALGEDVVHLAQSVSSAPLRGAIDAAFRGDPRTRVEEVRSADLTSGETQYLRISCAAEPPAQGGAAEMVVLLISDITEPVQARLALEGTVERLQEEGTRQAAMLERLTETNRQLLAANDELAAGNTALRSANDELLVGYEELQAASEEVETLNEEMQATNEELQTTNDDLAVRGAELQEMAASLEEQHQRSETERARVAAVLASMGDAVLAVAPDGTPVVTNAAYDQTFGAGASELVLEDEHERRLPAEAGPWRRAARGEAFSMAFSLRAADGTRRWFEAVGQPLRSEDAARGAVVVIREVTERSLRRLQETFIATASHELRTPLTALQGYLQLLARALPPEGEGDARPRELGTLALTQVRRLGALVNELLDVSRLQSGKLSLTLDRLDLVPLVARIVAVTQTLAEGQQIALDAPAEPAPVMADAGRLEQVLVNLLMNAIKFAPGTDRIDVRVRRVAERRRGPRDRAHGAVEIEVRDFGPGIPAANLPHIFSRFYQVADVNRRMQSGMGLGLFISKEIMTAHDGAITVESTEGAGTTFTVRLPLADTEGDRGGRPRRRR